MLNSARGDTVGCLNVILVSRVLSWEWFSRLACNDQLKNETVCAFAP